MTLAHERRVRSTGVLLAASLLMIAVSSPAAAAVPGVNGRIAFTSVRDGYRDIFTMQPDGGGLRRLLNDRAPDFSPAWSPDGEMLAFTSLRLGSSHFDQIYTMNARGGELVRLTDVQNGNATGLAWSPDGRTIAFAISFGPRDDELALVDSDGSNFRRLTANGISDSDPTWTPDGSLLVFGRDARIVSIIPEGAVRDLRFITPGRLLAFEPSVSPDGRRIAFIGRWDRSSSRQYDLFTIGLDGTGLQRLTRSSDDETQPSWSPDGRRIALMLVHTGPEDDRSSRILTMRTDGSHVHRLSPTGGFEDGSPDWRTLPA